MNSQFYLCQLKYRYLYRLILGRQSIGISGVNKSYIVSVVSAKASIGGTLQSKRPLDTTQVGTVS